MEQNSQSANEPEDPHIVASYNIEIYKQKYENFRHFDRLRWQAPGIALAIAAGVVAFSAREGTARWLPPVLLFLLGVLTWLCAFTMLRISKQLECNRVVLVKFAELIGDKEIPLPTKRGASWFFQGFLWLVGACCLVAGSVIAWRTLR